MTVQSNENLERQLSCLESRVKRLKAGLIFLLLFLLIWCFLSWPPDVVKAKKFILQDEFGRIRAVFGFLDGSDMVSGAQPSIALFGQDVDSKDLTKATSTYLTAEGLYVAPGRLEDFYQDIISMEGTPGLVSVSPLSGFLYYPSIGSGAAAIPLETGTPLYLTIADGRAGKLHLTPQGLIISRDLLKVAEIGTEQGETKLVLYSSEKTDVGLYPPRAELSVGGDGILRIVCYNENGEIVLTLP